jgi:addiction module HigA family antidote
MSAGGRSKGRTADEAGHLTPGAHLRAEIERLGLDQVAVSKATGVSRQSVNNIINGRQPISRAMAGKLGRLTGRSSDYWLSEFFPATGKGRAAKDMRIAAAGVLVDHQIVRAVNDGIIGLTPFITGNVRAAAIDLTLAKAVTLAPGSSASAQTKERIELPRDYLGRIGIVGPLARLGLVAAHAFQIEPGFQGHIEFCLFNAGSTALRLRAAEPVVGLEIVRLAVPSGAGLASGPSAVVSPKI